MNRKKQIDLEIEERVDKRVDNSYLIFPNTLWCSKHHSIDVCITFLKLRKTIENLQFYAKSTTVAPQVPVTLFHCNDKSHYTYCLIHCCCYYYCYCYCYYYCYCYCYCYCCCCYYNPGFCFGCCFLRRLWLLERKCFIKSSHITTRQLNATHQLPQF